MGRLCFSLDIFGLVQMRCDSLAVVCFLPSQMYFRSPLFRSATRDFLSHFFFPVSCLIQTLLVRRCFCAATANCFCSCEFGALWLHLQIQSRAVVILPGSDSTSILLIACFACRPWPGCIVARLFPLAVMSSWLVPTDCSTPPPAELRHSK
jgi:hypothetical protein